MFVHRHAGRIVRRIDDDHPGARRDRRANAIPWKKESPRGIGRAFHRNEDRDATSQLDRRPIAVIGRFDHDHFVTRPDPKGDKRQVQGNGAVGHGDAVPDPLT